MIYKHYLYIVITLLLNYSNGQQQSDNTREVFNAPPFDYKGPYEPIMTQELSEARRQLMYPYNVSDFLDITSSKPMHDEPLPFLLRFFGFEYQYMYILKDGYIGFNKGLLSYKFPLKFPMIPLDEMAEEDPSLIAPFFALQDIPSSRDVPLSGVYFKKVNLNTEPNITLRDRLLLDFREGMIGAADFRPKYALIITWRNMTFVSRRDEKPLKTNTYQCVIATDEMRTYVMFNYEQIEWITHADNYEGLKGPAAFIGFNAGNTTRTFEFRPYSQQPRISYITSRGYGNQLEGRYFFQVNEEVYAGSCIEKDLDPNLPDRLPLSFFPRFGHMLGGTLVDITGPCLQPTDIIVCTFENIKVEGIFRSTNHLTCISPPLMYHGYIDLTVTVNDRTSFLGRFYLQPPDVAVADVIVLEDQDREEKPSKLTLKWDSSKLYWDKEQLVNISLWGYRETSDLYPSLTYIDTLQTGVKLGSPQYVLDTEKFIYNTNTGKLDILFGYIAVSLLRPTVLGEKIKHSPILWSRSMPLSWYFWRQWEREYGRNGGWKRTFCKNWYEREEASDRYATTVARCPCTADQALQDMGRFLPDTECNLINKKCETFHKGAQRCFRTGRPSIGGSGQTCCYDDNKELIQTADTMYGGRPSRAFIYGKHPFKMRMMIPALSNWLHDNLPFFFCCKWTHEEDNSDTCQMYNYWRTSQDCSSYQMPAVGNVFGDPHFITFDGTNYTFNGKGEFVLVHVDDPVHKLDIQGRFEQVPRSQRTEEKLKATLLTAIAAKDNQSATVEFRIRPKAARWRYHMYVIVDKEYVFFWDESLRVQNFRGVTLYQPEGITNMSQIIAMFDSGTGLEVLSTNGFMTARIYLPVTFLNKTAGLMGNYTRRREDDFVTPNRRYGDPMSIPMQMIHEFGMSWRVQEGYKKEGVGSSLFWHDSKTFSQYDDHYFEPELRLPPNELMLREDQDAFREEMDRTCGESVACRYDYLITLDKSFAEVTKMHESWAYTLQSASQSRQIRCPALSKPLNGRKSENRYSPGIIITFQCDKGYRLVGHESRVCRDNGLWSWGIDPVCISETNYILQIFLVTLSIIIPILLIIVCTILAIRNQLNGQEHLTGEPGRIDKFPQYTAKVFQTPEQMELTETKRPLQIHTDAREEEI